MENLAPGAMLAREKSRSADLSRVDRGSSRLQMESRRKTEVMQSARLLNQYELSKSISRGALVHGEVSGTLEPADGMVDLPVLALMDYGYEWTWMSDVFTLPHNAIRREWMDFYSMFAAFHRSRFHLDTDQVKELLNWWYEFFDFVVDCFTMDEDFVYPFLEKPYHLKNTDPPGFVRNLRDQGQKISCDFMDLTSAFAKTEDVLPEKQLPVVFKKVDPVARDMLNYFARQEKELPKLVEQNYVAKDKYALDREMIHSWLKRKSGSTSVVMLVRWIEEKATLQQWMSENLSPTSLISFHRWQSHFNTGHMRRAAYLIEKNQAVDLHVAQELVSGPEAIPSLAMCEYGFEWHWSRDPFALVNNGVRRELMDLYRLMDFMKRTSNSIHIDDVQEFCEWFKDCKAFVEVFLGIYEKVLLPWLSRPFIAGEDKAFLDFNEKIHGSLGEILTRFSHLDTRVFMFGSKLDAETFEGIIVAIKEFVPLTNSFFLMMERRIPKFVEIHQTIDAKEVVEKEIAEFVLRRPNSHLNIVLLTRWIEKKEVLHEWLQKNLRSVQRVQYNLWVKQFVANHRNIVEDFHRRNQAVARGEKVVRNTKKKQVISPPRGRRQGEGLATPREKDRGGSSVM